MSGVTEQELAEWDAAIIQHREGLPQQWIGRVQRLIAALRHAQAEVDILREGIRDLQPDEVLKEQAHLLNEIEQLRVQLGGHSIAPLVATTPNAAVAGPLTVREELEVKYGQVWDTQQLQADFIVNGFMAPFVGVTRKSDGKKGCLEFQHSPRYYFSFKSDD